MNEIDPDKEWRLQRETDNLHTPFVESAGQTLLDFLQKSANDKIFEKRGGKLTVIIPTGGGPNARVITSKDKQFEPRIEISFSMLLEIYKDALAFPLISARIEVGNHILEELHQQEQFKGAHFTFDHAIPELADNLVEGPLAVHSKAMEDIVAQSCQERITKNDIRCRFLMFEIMIVWTFFHELSHVLQQHCIVRERFVKTSPHSDRIDELDSNNQCDANLCGQAREILADAEAIHLTLQYFSCQGRLNCVTSYLLLCAVSCMFQRFYNNYSESLELTSGQHPHPFMRNEFADVVAMKWLKVYLVKSEAVATAEEAALPLVYYKTRASIFGGLYRAYRVEKVDGVKLPSFMELASVEHNAKKLAYIKTLAEHIERQQSAINELHLDPAGGFPMILAFVLSLKVST